MAMLNVSNRQFIPIRIKSLSCFILLFVLFQSLPLSLCAKPFSLQTWQKPTNKQLRQQLTSEQYLVTQDEGTEMPFHNAYWDNKKQGIYVDVVSGEPLFSSTDKFRSGTGWPSFTHPLKKEYVIEKADWSAGFELIEVRSKNADSHLGHVFDDGADAGLRYCINSASLKFIPKNELVEQGYPQFLKFFTP